MAPSRPMARGLDPDAARAEILPSLHELMVQFTGNVPAVNNAFGVQLVDWCTCIVSTTS